MGAPAARIPHSPPFSLPSLRGRAEGRALMSFGRGSMGFRNNLVSSLGRRNGIETNFIKQISLKRALPPPLPIRTFTIPDPWEDSFLSWCKKQKQRVLFLSRNSRHPLFRFLFTGAAAPPSPKWDALRFPPPFRVVAASLWNGCSITSRRSITRTAGHGKRGTRGTTAPPCSPDAASPWSTWPSGNTTRLRALRFRPGTRTNLTLTGAGPGTTWNNREMPDPREKGEFRRGVRERGKSVGWLLRFGKRERNNDDPFFRKPSWFSAWRKSFFSTLKLILRPSSSYI